MNNYTNTFFGLLMFFSLHIAFGQKVWDVTQLGVLRNDTTVNQQEAIQRVIDQVAEAGGGQVYFPSGDYMSGTIVLKSNITLHLEAGATLYASLREEDYENDFNVFKKGMTNDPAKATPVLIYAKEAHNIGIMGMGKIHGRARRVYEPLKQVDGFIKEETQLARDAGEEMKMYYKVKPYTCMIFLESCTNVRIAEVTLEESTDWTLHFKWCEQLVVDGVKIYSDLDKGVNADGIDVDGCKDVAIANCIIKTGDDAIVLKSTETDGRYESCERITVTNCTLVSTSTALKLGTESFGDFRNILFSDCVITDSNRGLGIIIRDGGKAEDVAFSNISIETNRKHFNWWGNGDPIWVVVKKRKDYSTIGTVENIRFENIHAVGQGTSKIEGYDVAHLLKNIAFSNVHLRMDPEDQLSKRSARVLEVHDVEDLQLRNCSFTWHPTKKQTNWAESVYLENTFNFRLTDLQVASYQNQTAPALHFRNTKEVLINGLESKNTIQTLVEISGESSQHLVLNDIDLMKRSREKVFMNKEVSVSEVSIQ